jgi:hypothetical protein
MAWLVVVGATLTLATIALAIAGRAEGYLTGFAALVVFGIAFAGFAVPELRRPPPDRSDDPIGRYGFWASLLRPRRDDRRDS